MSSIEVRRFRRDDRHQLADLVNAHAAAVVPGVSASVNTVLSQLEREPGEFVVDPWVSERLTRVAERRQRVVAAAHLLHYAGEAPLVKAMPTKVDMTLLVAEWISAHATASLW